MFPSDEHACALRVCSYSLLWDMSRKGFWRRAKLFAPETSIRREAKVWRVSLTKVIVYWRGPSTFSHPHCFVICCLFFIDNIQLKFCFLLFEWKKINKLVKMYYPWIIKKLIYSYKCVDFIYHYVFLKKVTRNIINHYQ